MTLPLADYSKLLAADYSRPIEDRLRDLLRAAGEDAEKSKEQTGHAIDGHALPWRRWQERYFPHVAYHEPSAFHVAFWEWISALQPSESAESFVGCVFRGAGKSTTFELGATYVGANLLRRFALVTAERQEQADERVQAIRSHFERIGVGGALTKQGHSKGWRRDQLRTENGFNVAGIGLDVAARGIKFDEFRPDWIHFDDIDNTEDTPAAVKKKLRLLTQGILKAGVRGGTAVSFCQNLIHDNSLMARALGMVKSDDDGFLLDATRIGPVNGFEGLKIEREDQPDGSYRWRIREARPVWGGFTVAEAERELNRDGKRAFLREVQNDVAERGGGLWDGYDFRYWDDPASRPPVEIDPKTGFPTFTSVVVALDPSGSSRGDEVGIVAAGLFRLPFGDTGAIVLADKSGNMSPADWAKVGVNLYHDLEASALRAEQNFGGEMVAATIAGATIRDEENGLIVRHAPQVELVHSSRGKMLRAEPIHGEYERGRVWHARAFRDLESEMRTWHPSSGLPSPGRLDAVVFALTDMVAGNANWGELKQAIAASEAAETETSGWASALDAYTTSTW